MDAHKSTTLDRVAVFLKDDFDPPENSVMTEAEWDVYSLLSAAYSAFIRLDALFPGDRGEFSLGINQLKSVLMSRPVERELKVIYDRMFPEDGPKVDNVRAAAQQPTEPVDPNYHPDEE